MMHAKSLGQWLLRTVGTPVIMMLSSWLNTRTSSVHYTLTLEGLGHFSPLGGPRNMQNIC